MQALVVCNGTGNQDRKGEFLHKRIVEAHGVEQLLETRLSQSHSTQSGWSESGRATAIPRVKKASLDSRDFDRCRAASAASAVSVPPALIGDAARTVAPAQIDVFPMSFRRADPAEEAMMQP